jgi:hypothetical protein
VRLKRRKAEKKEERRRMRKKRRKVEEEYGPHIQQSRNKQQKYHPCSTTSYF